MKYFLLALLVFSTGAFATLENEVKALDLKDNELPAGINNEKLYAVQTRFVPLSKRLEFSLGAGKALNPGSFLESQDLLGQFHFYMGDRWFLASDFDVVFNQLSSDGQRLWDNERIYPDISCVKYRADALLGFNLLYGKFRLSLDQVFYIDQYIALGGGLLRISNGLTEEWHSGPVGELGLVLWFTKKFNSRLSVRDYYARDFRRLGSDWAHQWVGTVTVGYLFGEGRSEAR